VSSVDRARTYATGGLIAWAAFAFGAVYPWGYVPLAIGAVVLGGLGLPANRTSFQPSFTTIATALVLAAVALQLVPLAVPSLATLSPGSQRVLTATDVGYAIGARATHPLSVSADRTMLGLAAFAMLLVWCASTAAIVRKAPALQAVAGGVVLVGACLAVVGLAQQATFNGKLLWFWTPRFYATNAFGPFVNRNHFAGWMLLAIALGVGWLFGRIGDASGLRAPTWRERILWLGSKQATPLIVVGAAVIVMACALVWTMSRSGIAATGVALAILLAAALRRSKRTLRRLVLAGYLVMTVAGVIAWRGEHTLASWYRNTTTLEWRVRLWEDTMPALKEFWLTGSGVNTYGTVMLVYPRTDTSVQPREAHNDYLQMAVEGGLLVCVPAVLLVVAVGRAISARLRQPQSETAWWIRMGAVAGICGMAVQELTEFSLQIPAVALLFVTCVAIAIHQPAQAPARRVRPQPAGALVTSI
jgi:O-antigen ligase